VIRFWHPTRLGAEAYAAAVAEGAAMDAEAVVAFALVAADVLDT
jgi:hypothetical protein